MFSVTRASLCALLLITCFGLVIGPAAHASPGFGAEGQISAVWNWSLITIFDWLEMAWSSWRSSTSAETSGKEQLRQKDTPPIGGTGGGIGGTGGGGPTGPSPDPDGYL